ncbi:nitrate ABC transporter substrate-binding protein [Clostridium botulinum]|nr:nitrate ABC transporter substrate-binding protein [Clostridium botulinum]
MVEAQTKMQTDMLVALMILAALIGFFIDMGLLQLNKLLTKWRYVQ